MSNRLTCLDKDRVIDVIFDGGFITISKLSKMFAMPYDVLYNRIVYRHENVSDAVNTPLRQWERRRV